MKKTITLYTMSWNGYWNQYGRQWSGYINKLNTQPDEIIIVSDVIVDTSFLDHPKIKNIVIPIEKHVDTIYQYRTSAVNHSIFDWIVASDIDDMPLPNYLDGLDIDADICGFSFMEQASKKIYKPDDTSLEKRLLDIVDGSLIPGTSAIKRSVFDKIRYERSTHEDLTLWSIASKLNLTVANPTPDDIRFVYNGFHSKNKETKRVSDIYRKALTGNRNLYCFWFSGEMSENRKKCLDILKEKSNVNVIVIDLENFYSYEHKDLPIHKGFRYLSDVHKSDYARAYMMYFYGEGYSDIKANSFDWNPYFDQLFLSKKDAIGYRTAKPTDIGVFWGEDMAMKNTCLARFNELAGNGHFIFKPKTQIAYDWITTIHKMMDENYDQLKNYPGMHPLHAKGQKDPITGLIKDPKEDYPFGWADIGGLTKHKIEYMNNFSNFILTMPHTNNKNYR